MPTENRSSNTDPRDVFIRLNPLGLGEEELRKDSTGFEDQRTHNDYLLFLAGYHESQPNTTDLVEVKTADLFGEPLAWAVGKAEGLDVRLAPPGYNGVPWRVFVRYTGEVIVHDARFDPYENWAVGGPLLDKHHGSAQHFHGLAEGAYYSGGPSGAETWSYGPTALVAFCRGLVNHKLGDTVQVPKDLMP